MSCSDGSLHHWPADCWCHSQWCQRNHQPHTYAPCCHQEKRPVVSLFNAERRSPPCGSLRMCRCNYGMLDQIYCWHWYHIKALSRRQERQFAGRLAPAKPPHLHEFCHKQHAAALHAGAIKLHDVAVPAQVPVEGSADHLRLPRSCCQQCVHLEYCSTPREFGTAFAQQASSQAARLSMAISRTKASSELRSPVRAIVLMACMCRSVQRGWRWHVLSKLLPGPF
jgi:hypothetical protein